MAILNNFKKNLTQHLTEDSASWGSLILLVCALALVMLMMLNFAYIQPAI